jgi:hypothetical protein
MVDISFSMQASQEMAGRRAKFVKTRSAVKVYPNENDRWSARCGITMRESVRHDIRPVNSANKREMVDT